MTQIHVVIRRVNPALKIDLVQLGHIEHDQFTALPLGTFKDSPILSFLKSSDVSDSLFIQHSEIPALIAAFCSTAGFGLDFFDNTLVFTFNFDLKSYEGSTEKEG
nr:MAG TPA: hypothetical protein [Microviridae sp.]